MSDVHSNLEALEEALNHVDFDEVLCAGDVVDYGPDPLEVLTILQYVKAKRVLGNHDAAAAFRTDCRSSKAMHESSVVTRELITWRFMPKPLLETLGKAAKVVHLDLDGLRVRMFHAAPEDKLYKYITREEAAKMDMNGADLVVLGHTHIAYEVKTSGTWVVNPGSVGMPADGDPRASYAVLDTVSRSVTFGRVKYDIDAVVSKLDNRLGGRRDIFEIVSKALKTGQPPALQKPDSIRGGPPEEG